MFRLNEIDAKPLIKQIISSLQYISSKGVVHRDLKLANILINEDLVIKLADFGVST